MDKSNFKPFFDRIDAALLKISPQKDVMLLRVIAAFLHHISSVFVVVNAGRLYFTSIEESRFGGALFKKMDIYTKQRLLARRTAA